jgi:hypothetical protein
VNTNPPPLTRLAAAPVTVCAAVTGELAGWYAMFDAVVTAKLLGIVEVAKHLLGLTTTF